MCTILLNRVYEKIRFMYVYIFIIYIPLGDCLGCSSYNFLDTSSFGLLENGKNLLESTANPLKKLCCFAIKSLKHISTNPQNTLRGRFDDGRKMITIYHGQSHAFHGLEEGPRFS